MHSSSNKATIKGALNVSLAKLSGAETGSAESCKMGCVCVCEKLK